MGAVQSLSKDDIKRSNDIHFGFFGLDGLPFTKLAGNGDNPTHEKIDFLKLQCAKMMPIKIRSAS